jgi:hypothetical protein
MNPDPRIKQLASEAARKIKAITNERNADIESVYADYQQKVALIRAESTADGIAPPPTLPSVPQVHH